MNIESERQWAISITAIWVIIIIINIVEYDFKSIIIWGASCTIIIFVWLNLEYQKEIERLIKKQRGGR